MSSAAGMLCSLLECTQIIRRTAVQTVVHVITTEALIALGGWVAPAR